MLGYNNEGYEAEKGRGRIDNPIKTKIVHATDGEGGVQAFHGSPARTEISGIASGWVRSRLLK